MEAGREGRVRQVRQIQAARRGAFGPRRRKGRQGRSRRVAGDQRHAASSQCAVVGRSRLCRSAAARSSADHQGRFEPQADQFAVWRSVHAALQFDAAAARQSENPRSVLDGAQSGRLHEGRGRRSRLLQGLQELLPLRHANGDGCGHGRAADRQRRQSQGNGQSGRLQGRADRADGVDRSGDPHQPVARRQAIARTRRLQHRHAVDGLADARRAPREEDRRRRAAGTCSIRCGSASTCSILR